MNNSTALICRAMLIGAVMIMPSVGLASHPNHFSNAEVNWNPKSGNFEVALCVWPNDLEKALANDQSKIIDLDKIDNLDELMKSYIEKRFLIRQIQSAQGTGQDPPRSLPLIRWVGHERNLKTAWLYFEVEGDKQGGQWTIENRVFFELNEDQLNQLQISAGKQSNIVVSRSGESRFTLDTSGKDELDPSGGNAGLRIR